MANPTQPGRYRFLAKQIWAGAEIGPNETAIPRIVECEVRRVDDGELGVFWEGNRGGYEYMMGYGPEVGEWLDEVKNG